MTLQTRSTCHCSSNSGSSSSTSLTTSLTRISFAAQLVAQAEDLLDRDGGLQHHLQHAPVALLDALGDLDLALAREQRDRPHLAQVGPHGIAGRGIAVSVVVVLVLGLDLGLGIGIGLAVGLGLFVVFRRGLAGALLGRLGLRRGLDDVDALAANADSHSSI